MRAYELHASPKQVQRSKGRSAVAAAAYRSASRLVDERTGLIHDYTKKQGVQFTRIYTPDNAPAWAKDRGKLWNAVESIEKKSNSMTAREWEIAFPFEFNALQRREAGDAVARELMKRYNCAVDIAYHEPSKDGDQRNHHAHILYTTRGLDENTPTGWAKNKYRDLSKDFVLDEQGKPVLNYEGKKLIKSSKEALEIREYIASSMNIIAERDGLEVHTEHLSFEQRGIDKEPTKHLGANANEMEKKGQDSRIGDENRAIKSANDNRQKLTDKKKLIDLDHEREKRKLDNEQEHFSWFENLNTAFNKAPDGQTFVKKLERLNLKLAAGKTGSFMFVDGLGGVHSLVKNLEDKSFKDVEKKLADLEKTKLENADKLAEEIKDRIKYSQGQEQQKQDYVKQLDDKNKVLQFAKEQDNKTREKQEKAKAERENKALMEDKKGQHEKVVSRPDIAIETTDKTADTGTDKRKLPEWHNGLNQAYIDAKDGLYFRRNLSEKLGLTLALAKNNQLYIVDATGEIKSLEHNIEGQNVKQIKTRLGNVKPETLQTPIQVQKFIHQELYSGRNFAQAEQINKYRVYWEVDYLQGQYDVRVRKLAGLSAWDKVAKRGEYLDLQTDIEARGETLRDQKQRLAEDINAVYEKAPDYVRKAQLKKHGVEYQGEVNYTSREKRNQVAVDLKNTQTEKMKIAIQGGVVEEHGRQQRQQAEELRVKAQREQKKALAVEKIREREQAKQEQEPEKFKQSLSPEFVKELGTLPEKMKPEGNAQTLAEHNKELQAQGVDTDAAQEERIKQHDLVNEDIEEQREARRKIMEKNQSKGKGLGI